ncbi:MAG: MlaD family protein [Burkholderiales bacterium]
MKRNALLIGSFVIVGLVLVVTGMLWLSGNTLFKKQVEVMIYFKSSVTGLYVGAPVNFRGVAVGQVEEIGIQVDRDSLLALVPVRVDLQPNALRFSADNKAPLDVPTLVQRGLRARLASQSIVTGQKIIELDFVPNTPSTLVSEGKRPEIPALADRFGSLIDQLAELPLRDTVQDLRDTLAALRGTLTTTQTALAGATDMLEAASKELKSTGADARATLTVASEAVRQVQANSTKTLAAFAQLSETTRNAVTAAQPELQRTLVGARDAAESARLAMNRVAEMAAPGAPLRGDLDTAARDLSQAARSLRDWAELLEDKPNAVIFGNKRE